MADLSDNTNWFETDASNNKASPNGWPEGMMPSGVNDTARGDKGALKRFWDRINPVQGIAQAGDGNWFFVTSNTAYPTAYVDGEVYAFKAESDGTGGDRFEVNTLGLKPIYVVHADNQIVPLAAFDIMGGYRHSLVYDASLNSGSGGFILLNPWLPIWNSSAGTTVFGDFAANGDLHVAGGISASSVTVNGSGLAVYVPAGLIQTDYNGSSSGGIAIRATGGAIESDYAGGTAFYAPNGNFVGVNITVSGNGYKPGGGSWVATSDARLKEAVTDYSAGLAKVMALRPVAYCYNGRGGSTRDGRRYVGLVADEVEGVMPEMVGTISELLDPGDAAPSEIKTLDTTALTFALVNCVKELAARVASLEADVRD
jgi:hypothetical protein